MAKTSGPEVRAPIVRAAELLFERYLNEAVEGLIVLHGVSATRQRLLDLAEQLARSGKTSGPEARAPIDGAAGAAEIADG